MQVSDWTYSKQMKALEEFRPTTESDNAVLVISEKREGIIDTSSRRETVISTICDKHCPPKERQIPTVIKFDKCDPGILMRAVVSLNRVKGTTRLLNMASVPFNNPEP